MSLVLFISFLNYGLFVCLFACFFPKERMKESKKLDGRRGRDILGRDGRGNVIKLYEKNSFNIKKHKSWQYA